MPPEIKVTVLRNGLPLVPGAPTFLGETLTMRVEVIDPGMAFIYDRVFMEFYTYHFVLFTIMFCNCQLLFDGSKPLHCFKPLCLIYKKKYRNITPGQNVASYVIRPHYITESRYILTLKS